MLIEDVRPYTKSSPKRLRAMVASLETVDKNGIEGDVVECGVWRGGNIILARARSPGRVCWLYHTFAGMTLPTHEDVTRGGRPASDRWVASEKHDGWDAVPLDEVKSYLRLCNAYDESKLRFVVGPVEKTLLHKDNLPEKIALLRLDTDWYASTRIELEVLFPRLSVGGVLIVDDYGHWMGARKAVNEYFSGIGMQVTKRRIDYTAIYIVKP